MIRKRKHYREIVRRYLDHKASEEELEVFFSLIREGKLNRHLRTAMKRDENDLLKQFTGEEERASGRWRTYAIAAIICGLVVGAATWWRAGHRPITPVAPAVTAVKDMAPGRSHAVLTLQGGKSFDLDSDSKSTLTLPAGTRLVRTAAGEWVYTSPVTKEATVLYNTISAPRGGQFPFMLEDGTRVWLNAASSLRFPTAFPGGNREVFLEGEAYFEVAPDVHRSFVVRVGNEAVTVLGTTFNVNGYPDEPAIRTTLIDGSVRIERNGASILMHPGEIASITDDARVDRLADADAVGASVAWRTGYFSFDQDDIRTVMRQIGRWYDVDIRYEGPVTGELFGGTIGRDLSLMQALTILEKSQVHFRLDGKVLTVLP
ncbi:FecR family protein [Dinghuibacter silviterrae]|uniref:FecR family protein n=1 Tax=Dinghuibacter silviterrae TaxID=1539049 RepID=A0A4R8DFN8_9BACT|nr:FecR domain-containing protein [Dinghuibacter silviterrae]TDW95906.1 FecR family protein [Dinghuibacter silviterrae]